MDMFVTLASVFSTGRVGALASAIATNLQVVFTDRGGSLTVTTIGDVFYAGAEFPF